MPIFRNLPLLEKCINPLKIDMQTQSIYGFFFAWVGSYENHCFGIDIIPHFSHSELEAIVSAAVSQ